MNVKWLITRFGHESDIQRLYYAVEEFGREVEIMPLGPFYEALENKSDERSCCIVTGPINITKMAYRNRPHWVPCSWHDPEFFKCSNYYAYFGKYLTQQVYAFMPFSELKRRVSWIYETFGVDGHVFFRPDYGEKVFTGELVWRDRFEAWYEQQKEMYYVEPTNMAIVSRPTKIEKELRLLVHNGKVVTGSTYRIASHIEQEPLEVQPDKDAIIAFVESVIAENAPPNLPPVYAFDIAKEPDRYSVMEVGCITAAGLYHMDFRKVVEALTLAAETQYADIYGS